MCQEPIIAVHSPSWLSESFSKCRLKLVPNKSLHVDAIVFVPESCLTGEETNYMVRAEHHRMMDCVTTRGSSGEGKLETSTGSILDASLQSMNLALQALHEKCDVRQVTQNIDGLQPPSHDLIEAHGRVGLYKCIGSLKENQSSSETEDGEGDEDTTDEDEGDLASLDRGLDRRRR